MLHKIFAVEAVETLAGIATFGEGGNLWEFDGAWSI
jgi:hypothetical protein